MSVCVVSGLATKNSGRELVGTGDVVSKGMENDTLKTLWKAMQGDNDDDDDDDDVSFRAKFRPNMIAVHVSENISRTKQQNCNS